LFESDWRKRYREEKREKIKLTKTEGGNKRSEKGQSFKLRNCTLSEGI